jgi:hypothetical protein
VKRNIIYLLLLVALGYLVYYFVRNGASTFGLDDRDFSVKDTADVGKIFIANMNGEKLEVVRGDNGWVLDNKYPERKKAVSDILGTLKAMTVRFPVADAAMNTVVKTLATSNKKVEVYDRKGNKIKSIYIGEPPPDEIGNYMLIDGSKTPFVVSVPGFKGTLETRFVSNEIEMRSHTIVSIPPTALSEIEVNYLDRPDSSFAIKVFRRDSFLIYNPGNNSSLYTQEINKEKLFSFLNFLEDVNCEGYANEIPGKDTIIAKGPYCKITITTRDKAQQVITLYHRPIDQRSLIQSDAKGNPLPYDIDHFYGLVNDNKDFVLLQRYHFGRLLRSVDYFRK